MLEPIKRTRLFEVVIERILGLIKDGSLKPGDHLPTERDLAAQLDVSRTSIREGLRALEMMGYVESRVGVGGGTFIKNSSPDEMIEPMTRLLNTYKKKEFFLQIVEVRIIFESATAKLAARRRNDADLGKLEETLSFMKKEIGTGEIGLKGDSRFHTALAQATHNEILIKFADLLEELLSDARRTTLEIPGIPQESLDDHYRIFDAIKRRSEKDSVAFMKAHLRKAHDMDSTGQLDFDI
jgi:GntR family transcriptional repressor for pyruvate dehydrogenase complex